MNLDIVIPSKNRVDKLTNCLNSIFHSAKEINVNIKLYFSSYFDLYYFDKFLKNIPNVYLYKMDEYKVPTFWNSYLKECKADAVMYLNDDVEFFKETLSTTIEEYKQNFPDYDGVLGLTQCNIPDSQAVAGAFGVIGIKYADRFPDRQVFCPDYHRFFGDFELWQYSKSINKFILSSKARILHLHPAFTGELPDKTHREVRKWLPIDRKTYQKREQMKLLWGKSFERINKE